MKVIRERYYKYQLALLNFHNVAALYNVQLIATCCL